LHDTLNRISRPFGVQAVLTPDGTFVIRAQTGRENLG
jgi:hypothetical protein